MKKSIWEKEMVVKVTLASKDVTDWVEPLPLFLGVKYHHYIGQYVPLIAEYFQPFMPYPYN